MGPGTGIVTQAMAKDEGQVGEAHGNDGMIWTESPFANLERPLV